MKKNFYALSLLLASSLSIAFECPVDVELENPGYPKAVEQLTELGFIKGQAGKRNYNTKSLGKMTAVEVATLYQGISSAKDPSAQFWLSLAGTTLDNSEQAQCFAKLTVLKEQKLAVKTLQNLSKLRKRLPENDGFILAMTNITQAADGETLMAYLQSEQAVYYTSSIQGHVSNKANARHNRKKMQHLPNSLMQLMAQRIKEDGAAHRSTVYQVKHMGYE